jgi:hypothetical protein
MHGGANLESAECGQFRWDFRRAEVGQIDRRLSGMASKLHPTRASVLFATDEHGFNPDEDQSPEFAGLPTIEDCAMK